MSSRHEACTRCEAIITYLIPKVASGSSCHECGRYAHFADQPAYLYLLTNLQLKLHKVGIGTVGNDKNHLQQLIEAGWTVHGLWHAVDKGKTFRWEQEIFKQLKKQIDAADVSLPGLVGRSDRDWVESISALVISVADLSHLMSKVVFGKVK